MNTEVSLTKLEGRIDRNDTRIDGCVEDIGELKINKVACSDFTPVKELVFGFSKLILTAVVLALIYQVVKK